MKKTMLPIFAGAAWLILLLPACNKSDVAAPPAALTVAHKTATAYDAALRGTSAAAVTAEVPTTWYPTIINLIRSVPGQGVPGSASRSYAYIGISLYESVVPGMPAYQSLQGQLSGMPQMPQPEATKQYYYPACANAAIAGMVRHLFADASAAQQYAIDSLENVFYTSFQSTVSQQVLDRSVAYGKSVADAVFEWSKGDGGHEAYLNPFPAYTPPQGPKYWVPQPGQSAPQPYWAEEMRSFIPGSIAATQPPPPIPFSTQPGSEFYREEMQVYKESINQDPDHKAAAQYWASIGGLQVSAAITTTVLQNKSASLATAAEAYCKVGIALADCLLSNWKTKFKYVQLRPITYIHNYIDPNWVPTIPTPPYPDYSGGFTAVTVACNTVLADLFGNNTSFTCTYINNLGYTPRYYRSFSECSREIMRSRFWGGVHIMSSNYVGLAQGSKVAAMVNALRFQQ